MKRNIFKLLTCLLIFSHVSSHAQETCFLGPLQGKNNGKNGFAYQGMDIHRNYIISCQNQGVATIYLLKDNGFEKKSQFNLGCFHKFNHANVASFGIEKVNKKDPFPVLCVSQCHRKPYKDLKDVLFVERISQDMNSSELVQTIFYDDTNKDFGYALQWVVDHENKMLYGYGNTINNSDPANKHRIIKFRLPKLKEGSFVRLKPEDALENYTIEEVSDFKFNPIGQGLFIYKQKLYMPTGLGTPEHPSILYIWDLKNKSMQEIDLSDETSGEFEDISIIKDKKGKGFSIFIQSVDGLFRIRL